MLFRFTLSNSIEGDHVISNPDGWKEIKIKLERDKDFHSLVEMIEVPLIFYGSNGDVDGGYDYIKNVEDTQGVDAIIEILIEVSDNGGDYETFFDGLLELETIKEISDAEPYKLECNIVRNDFWSKFFNRRSQKINLNSTTDLDGGTRAAIDEVNLYMTSQAIEMNDYSTVEHIDNINNDTRIAPPSYIFSGSDNKAPFDLNVKRTEEIQKVFTYPEDATSTVFEKYRVTYGGSYRFVISVFVANTVDFESMAGNFASTLSLSLIINGGTPIVATATLISGSGPYSGETITKYDMDQTVTLAADSSVIIKWEYSLGGPRSMGIVYNGVTYHNGTDEFETFSYSEIIAQSVYVNTQTDSFLLRDSARSILSKIVSRDNVLYSNYLGDEAPEGCGTNFAVMNGLHIRGYSMDDKPMSMSFDEWWHGANPIFNLGLGYETIAGTEYIRIEHKGYFYDDDTTLTLSNVDKITRVYDKDSIIKSIEIGYEKWSAESSSGVDDPQTKHTYNTRFKIIGKDEKILSRFIAASLAIEQTRRNRVEFGKDWRLDEETFIIALNNDASPYQPELDENFTSITDLLNSETRYNIRLTPARNFIRWRPFFNGCLQGYADTYKFASGEGNYDMQSTGDSCDSGTLAENQDIALTSDHYHLAEAYEFEYYLSWEDYKTIRANRHKAILVSNTTSDYKTCHIQEMEFDHYNSIAKFTVWIKE